MSKAQLKKQLKNFDAGQLSELVLELYCSNHDIKEYMEFWLNPDSEALAEKYGDKLLKCFAHSGYWRRKPDVRKAKAVVERFVSFRPDPLCIIKMYLNLSGYILQCGAFVTLEKLKTAATVLRKAMVEAEANGVYSQFENDMKNMAQAYKERCYNYQVTEYFPSQLLEPIKNTTL